MAKITSISVYQTIENNPKLAGFDLWWAAYPKKLAKGDAVKAWQQTAKVRPSVEEMLAKLENQRISDDWQRDSGQWIPYPASYLRAWRFLDE